jgi:hypothetical protein
MGKKYRKRGTGYETIKVRLSKRSADFIKSMENRSAEIESKACLTNFDAEPFPQKSKNSGERKRVYSLFFTAEFADRLRKTGNVSAAIEKAISIINQ